MKLTWLFPILSCLTFSTSLPIEHDQNDAAIYSRTIPQGLKLLIPRVETGGEDATTEPTTPKSASAEQARPKDESPEPVSKASTVGTISTVKIDPSEGGSGTGLFQFELTITDMDPEIYGAPPNYLQGALLFSWIKLALTHKDVNGLPDDSVQLMGWKFEDGPSENVKKVSFRTKAEGQVALALKAVWKGEMGTLKLSPKPKASA